MALRPRRIYLSHPLASLDAPTATSHLRALARAFPGASIVDAPRLYKSSADWLSRYRREVAACSAFVFHTFRGTIGFGVYRELVFAEDRGLPALLLHEGRLYNTWEMAILDHRNQWRRFARVRPRGHPVDPDELPAARSRRGLLPTGPLGHIIENRIIEYLLVLSDGRLIAYRPEADFGGTDLQVSFVHSRAVVKLQVKGRTDPPSARFLRFGVRPETIPPEDPKFLVFCWYNLKAADLNQWVWVVPSDVFRGEGRPKHGQIKADLSTLANAQDRWVDYRYNTKDIAWVVEELLKRA